MKIALQLYSVRDALEKDFLGTLQQIKAMGYDGVEFADLHGKTPTELKDLCEQAVLLPLSGQIWESVLEDPKSVISYYAQSGIGYVVFSLGFDLDTGKFVCDVEKPKAACKAAKELGLVPLYHNHNAEFKTIDGKVNYDALFDAIGEDLMAEPDLCWVQVAGVDPIEHLKRYTGRVPVVHLKDYWLPEDAAGIPHYGDIDEEEGTQFEFRPLGMGLLNLKAAVYAAKDAGAQILVVEQDFPTPGMTVLECAKISIDRLKEVMA